MNKLSKRWLSSDCRLTQILGAMAKRWWRIVTLLLILAMLTLWAMSFRDQQTCESLPKLHDFVSKAIGSSWYWFAFQTLLLALVFGVCNTLTDICSLRKDELGITRFQLLILVAIGLWIIGTILIFHIQKESKNDIPFAIIGGLLAWIFQDRVKGAVAFIHLRHHHLLAIDDWIQVPKYNVDGEVKRISLTTVTVYNWDTTTSTLPISALQEDHFINLQKMSEGKTYGRQMLNTFIFDTSRFRLFTKEDIEAVEQAHGIKLHLSENDIGEGMLNSQVYRLYLFHWLMNHPRVSQLPRLIVRWREQSKEGLPLQIYAFIICDSLAAFEWEQSQIMEHVIESLEWFGLRLYQSPSAYDARNKNVHLTETPATYGKEAHHG